MRAVWLRESQHTDTGKANALAQAPDYTLHHAQYQWSQSHIHLIYVCTPRNLVPARTHTRTRVPPTISTARQDHHGQQRMFTWSGRPCMHAIWRAYEPHGRTPRMNDASTRCGDMHGMHAAFGLANGRPIRVGVAVLRIPHCAVSRSITTTRPPSAGH